MGKNHQILLKREFLTLKNHSWHHRTCFSKQCDGTTRAFRLKRNYHGYDDHNRDGYRRPKTLKSSFLA